jgi:hypothetical protein
MACWLVLPEFRVGWPIRAPKTQQSLPNSILGTIFGRCRGGAIANAPAETWSFGHRRMQIISAPIAAPALQIYRSHEGAASTKRNSHIAKS